jgi:hypothetical protein
MGVSRVALNRTMAMMAATICNELAGIARIRPNMPLSRFPPLVVKPAVA